MKFIEDGHEVALVVSQYILPLILTFGQLLIITRGCEKLWSFVVVAERGAWFSFGSLGPEKYFRCY